MAEADFYRDFGQLVRVRRKKSALTQAQLAERLHVNRTTVTNIERGRQGVPLHSLVSLADALGCTPADLIPSKPQPGDSIERDEESMFINTIRERVRGSSDDADS